MRRLLAALTLFLSLLSPIALPIAAQQKQAVQRSNQTQTVYITRTGKRYHRDGCRYLSMSKIPIGLKDAKANGYTPCKVCHPPGVRDRRSVRLA
jgi:competence protein ComEC